MNNEYLLPSNEYNEFESRAYVDPNLQSAQTDTFINEFRQTQDANGREMSEQTEALGTTTPSNLGGLTGAGSYFSSRYQTPRTNSLLQNLRTAAQATAMNEALANEQAIWKKRYNEAYRNYQKKANDRANAPMSNPANVEPSKITTGGFEIENPAEETIVASTPGVQGGYTVPKIDTDTGTVLGYTYVPYGREYEYSEDYYLSTGDTNSGSNDAIIKGGRGR